MCTCVCYVFPSLALMLNPPLFFPVKPGVIPLFQHSLFHTSIQPWYLNPVHTRTQPPHCFCLVTGIKQITRRSGRLAPTNVIRRWSWKFFGTMNGPFNIGFRKTITEFDTTLWTNGSRFIFIWSWNLFGTMNGPIQITFRVGV